jgi:hypothetical protein
MSIQIKKFPGVRFVAGAALIVTGGLLLLLLGDSLFANTMTNWAYAQLTWPIILTGAGALLIFRAIGRRGESDRRDELSHDVERANQGHYAT